MKYKLLNNRHLAKSSPHIIRPRMRLVVFWSFWKMLRWCEVTHQPSYPHEGDLVYHNALLFHGAVVFSHLCCAQAGQVRFVWLVWMLHNVVKHSPFLWPWKGWKRCTSLDMMYKRSKRSSRQRRFMVVQYRNPVLTQNLGWSIFTERLKNDKMPCVCHITMCWCMYRRKPCLGWAQSNVYDTLPRQAWVRPKKTPGSARENW